MIEIRGIRIMQDYPGRASLYTIDVRFIDPEQGTHLNEQGFELWNYDKGITFGADTLEDAIGQLQEIITERLCS